jgi:hypothetical protein
MCSLRSVDRRSIEMNSHNSVTVRAAQELQKFHDFELLDHSLRKDIFTF